MVHCCNNVKGHDYKTPGCYVSHQHNHVCWHRYSSNCQEYHLWLSIQFIIDQNPLTIPVRVLGNSYLAFSTICTPFQGIFGQLQDFGSIVTNFVMHFLKLKQMVGIWEMILVISFFAWTPELQLSPFYRTKANELGPIVQME